MVVSNEPGYYESGVFGIRIENLLQVVEKDTPHNFADERQGQQEFRILGDDLWLIIGTCSSFMPTKCS